MNETERLGITKAFQLLDKRMFEDRALERNALFSGDDRGEMHSVRLSFTEMKATGIDPEIFNTSGNEVSAYSVLLREVLLNRRIPPSFVTDMQYGRSFRAAIDYEGVTFLVNKRDVVDALNNLSPEDQCAPQRRSDTPSGEAVACIYNAELDYKMADRQYGRAWHERVTPPPSTGSPCR